MVIGGSAAVIAADVERHVHALAVDFADAADVTFAQTTKGGGGAGTSLEGALGRPLDICLAESPEVLRGYGWLTSIPEQALEKVGGVDVLRRSGVFVDVTPVPGKGAVLQATDRFSQYDEAAAERVFGAVACALPAGMPRIIESIRHLEPSPIVAQDASKRCHSSGP